MPLNFIGEEPPHFSWIVVGEIAGSAFPASVEQLAWIKKQNIHNLISLSKDHVNRNCKDLNLNLQVIDVAEFDGPDEKTMQKFIEICENIRKKKESLLIHCRMGWGRTGTLLAIYLMAFHQMNAEQAIKTIRSKRPRSIETRRQELSVYQFEELLQNKCLIE